MLSEAMKAALKTTSPKQLSRCEDLLQAISNGSIRDWKDAMSHRKPETWGVVRSALKRLREAGLIDTSPEYCRIAYKPEATHD